MRREVSEVSALLATPASARPIVVYSEDAATYNMLGGYLEPLTNKYGSGIAYVTSDPADPRFADPRGMTVRYVRRLLPSWLPKIDSPVLFTTMPDLDRFHLRRPRGRTRCVYAFHALNSIHEVYRENAFDAYDDFFCTGPHHRIELERHFDAYGLPRPVLHEVGYCKLDRVASRWLAYTKRDASKPVVLLAPSWGKGNSLERAGGELVESLLAIGARVIVRPHPCFFLPIYPAGREIVSSLRQRFERDPLVSFETSIVGDDSFYEADLMITDFSGAAFEFALGTLRPVLFIDVARKTMNPNWQRLDLPTFEDTMRARCGEVLGVADLDQAGRRAEQLLARANEWRDVLLALRESTVYNFGRSGIVGAGILDQLAASS